ncbi:MAG TPA: condensation domain-containing protein [Streptosporangiaceae bacterium]|nr:condensation domain-containing protein [Streptosporangiaceae bacterium]
MERYPLSYSQEWFVTLDKGDDGGAFGPGFLLVCAVRITGHVDLALLRGALDDVVARHELLRTLVIRDADPPYQEVHPPCQVPLEVRDRPAVAGESRDRFVQELIVEAEAGTISTKDVPMLRAMLCRFDDRDSALVLTVHHSVSDGWSLQVILRDLGACYAARRDGVPADLQPVRQYREYAEWQKASATSTAEDGSPRYWADKLRGAREFTMPNDHGHPDSYTSHYSLYNDTIDASIVSAASALAAQSRTTAFTVLLSAFYVLAHSITGTTDLAIRAFTSGRGEKRFHDTMGLFINVLPFRTNLAGCTTFRDIITRAKQTFIDAIAHELPVSVIEQEFADFVKSRENLRTSQFIISETPAQYGEIIFAIADGAREVHLTLVEESRHHDIPSGMVWGLTPTPDGGLSSGILFNPDEFSESTIVRLAAGLRRILTSAVRDPDQDWKTLSLP